MRMRWDRLEQALNKIRGDKKRKLRKGSHSREERRKEKNEKRETALTMTQFRSEIRLTEPDC